MTVLAAARTVEELLARVGVAGKKLLDRIASRNAGGLDALFGPFVQKRGNVGDLFIGHIRQRRHAFVWTAAANHFADLVAFDIVSDKPRAHQVWSATARGIRTVAESAGFRELFTAALDGGIFGGRILGRGLGTRGRIPKTNEEKKCRQ